MNYKIRVNNPEEWSRAVKLFTDLGLVAHQRYLDFSGRVEYPLSLIVDNGKFDYNWSCFGEGELPSYEELTLDQLEALAAEVKLDESLNTVGTDLFCPVTKSRCIDECCVTSDNCNMMDDGASEVTPADILEATKIRTEQLAQEEQIGDEAEKEYYEGFDKFAKMMKDWRNQPFTIYKRNEEKPANTTKITIESYGRKHTSELPNGSNIHELLTSMFLLLEQASWQRDTIRDGLYELLDEWGMIERPADLDFEQPVKL